MLLSSLVIGIPFGVLARQAGLDLLQTSGMSVIVFAGAAQFAAIELLRTGASPVAVTLTALLLNLRHLLMAASLRRHFGQQPLARKLGLAYLLTDEAFALGIGWYRRGGRGLAYYATFAAALWACWNTGTIAGALLGGAIPDPRRLALDFAITATFTGIVAIGAHGRRDVAIALIAALLAGGLRGAGLGLVAVVAAGAIAPLIGLLRR